MSTIALLIILARIFYIDFKYYQIDLKTASLGIIYPFFLQSLNYAPNDNNQYLALSIDTLLDSIIVLLSTLLISILLNTISKREVIGYGDSYLLAMGTSWLGIDGIIMSLKIAFLSASLIVIIKRLQNVDIYLQKVPIGSYLSISIFIVWLYESGIIDI